MLATAMKIKEATNDSVMDISTLIMAKQILKNRAEMSDEEFSHAIFDYSCHLSALTATMVGEICLTEQEINDMVKTIQELNEMERNVINGNN